MLSIVVVEIVVVVVVVEVEVVVEPVGVEISERFESFLARLCCLVCVPIRSCLLGHNRRRL